MISPLLRTTRMPAKQVRVLFVMYVIRHVIGVVVFGWMISIGMQLGGIISILFPLLGLGYLGTAIFNGYKLHGQYRRAVEKERRIAAGASNATP